MAVVLVAGCSAPPAEVLDASEATIVNGSYESGFPSAVAMGAEINDVAFSMCTGNLITPEIVLSAGHCGDEIPIELIVELGQAFFGPSVHEPDEAIGFVDFAVHPDYVPLQNGIGGTLGEYDLSVFVLAEPAQARPTWFNRDPFTDEDVGMEMVSVGFGSTGADGYGSGQKRSAALTLDEYDEMFLITYSDTNPDEANICSGDSGGPQFEVDEDGNAVQLAVHSWGDLDCLVSGGSTRIDIAQEWLLDRIEEVHGTRDVCEASGWYDDGVCDEVCDEEDPDCFVGDDDTAGDDDVDVQSDEGDGCECQGASSSSGLGDLAVLALIGFSLTRRRMA